MRPFATFLISAVFSLSGAMLPAQTGPSVPEQISQLHKRGISEFSSGDHDALSRTAQQMWSLAEQARELPPGYRLAVMNMAISFLNIGDAPDIAQRYDRAIALAVHEIGPRNEKTVDLVAKAIAHRLQSGETEAAWKVGTDWLEIAAAIPDPTGTHPVETLVALLSKETRNLFGLFEKTSDPVFRDQSRQLSEMAWGLARTEESSPLQVRLNTLELYSAARFLSDMTVLDLLEEGYRMALAELGPTHATTRTRGMRFLEELFASNEFEESLFLARRLLEAASLDAQAGRPVSAQLMVFADIIFKSLGLASDVEALREVAQANRALGIADLRDRLAQPGESENVTDLKAQLAVLVDPPEAIALYREIIATTENPHFAANMRGKLAALLVEERQFPPHAP
ncbi:hypothetical protein [Aliiruegeria sabulilitoris]|uniref:hypothetical protein n=1 Tax=Aliiruegeria sabulilitoris TaxID=1510458 RepID=UPI0018D219BB|nr:hypothetical protein [Aliiruegeria sabulilitoris]